MDNLKSYIKNKCRGFCDNMELLLKRLTISYIYLVLLYACLSLLSTIILSVIYYIISTITGLIWLSTIIFIIYIFNGDARKEIDHIIKITDTIINEIDTIIKVKDIAKNIKQYCLTKKRQKYEKITSLDSKINYKRIIIDGIDYLIDSDLNIFDFDFDKVGVYNPNTNNFVELSDSGLDWDSDDEK